MSDDSTAARAAWRTEETRWSLAALERWEHSRRLVDVARDAMHRGDQASFAFPAIMWAGDVVAVGADVVRIANDHGVVDVRLDPSAPFVLRTRPTAHDGRRGDVTVTTFAARLRELDGTPVSIGLSAGSLEGTLRVGSDQVRLLDREGAAAYVPTGSVWWVRPLVDD